MLTSVNHMSRRYGSRGEGKVTHARVKPRVSFLNKVSVQLGMYTLSRRGWLLDQCQHPCPFSVGVCKYSIYLLGVVSCIRFLWVEYEQWKTSRRILERGDWFRIRRPPQGTRVPFSVSFPFIRPPLLSPLYSYIGILILNAGKFMIFSIKYF